jgi:hypothetical protein
MNSKKISTNCKMKLRRFKKEINEIMKTVPDMKEEF